MAETESKKGPIGRILSAIWTGVKTAAEIADVLLDLKMVSTFAKPALEKAGEATGDVLGGKVKERNKQGNINEFNEGLMQLDADQQTFIRILMRSMTPEERAAFIQRAARIGATAKETADYLRSLCNIGDAATALADLREDGFLKAKVAEKSAGDTIVGDMTAVRAEARAFFEEIENDIAGLNNPPQGGAQ